VWGNAQCGEVCCVWKCVVLNTKDVKQNVSAVLYDARTSCAYSRGMVLAVVFNQFQAHSYHVAL
jgi:hypothetical protein